MSSVSPPSLSLFTCSISRYHPKKPPHSSYTHPLGAENMWGARNHPIKLAVPNRLVYSPVVYGPGVYGSFPYFLDPAFPANLPKVWDSRLLTCSLTHLLTYLLTYSLTHLLTHSLTHLLYFRPTCPRCGTATSDSCSPTLAALSSSPTSATNATATSPKPGSSGL